MTQRYHGEKPGCDGITAEFLRAYLHYDPETGIMRRKSDGFRLDRDHHEGYLIANLKCPSCQKWHTRSVHRLAWLYMTGEYGPTQIDHENKHRDDNRWANLRASNSRDNHPVELPAPPQLSRRRDGRFEIKATIAGRQESTTRKNYADALQAAATLTAQQNQLNPNYYRRDHAATSQKENDE